MDNKNIDELSPGIKIAAVHHKIDKYFDRRGKKLGHEAIPKAQGMTMHYLMEHRDENVFQKDIEKYFNITGATATNILKGLEKSGLIVRVPMENDARMKKITLTEKAFEREEHIEESINILESSMLEGISEADLIKLHQILDKVTLNIDKLIQDYE